MKPSKKKKKTLERTPPNRKPDPAWKLACDEIVAAMLAAEVKACVAQRQPIRLKSKRIGMHAAIKGHLPQARKLWIHKHGNETEARACKHPRCRHYALLSANALAIEAAGAAPHGASDFYARTKQMLDEYLNQRS